MKEKGRERETDRQRQRETERERERQKQTDRQTDRETNRPNNDEKECRKEIQNWFTHFPNGLTLASITRRYLQHLMLSGTSMIPAHTRSHSMLQACIKEKKPKFDG